MLKRFGYTNIMMLGIMGAVVYFLIDFSDLTLFSRVALGLIGLTILVHIARIVMFMIEKRG